MPTYYDDNFGHWDDMGDPDMRQFYDKVQRESVWKTCQKCGKRVKLRRDYGICNTCATAMENGWEY